MSEYSYQVVELTWGPYLLFIDKSRKWYKSLAVFFLDIWHDWILLIGWYNGSMALNSSEMKARFQSRIHAGLQRVYNSYVAQGKNYPPIADQMWALLADAISDIAMDVVDEIQQNAEVVPGQSVLIPATSQPGAPSTGDTVSPGKII